MFYKNNSFVTKTFYGITFRPGDIKEVPGYINDKKFDVVAAPKPKEPPKSVEQPTKSNVQVETKVYPVSESIVDVSEVIKPKNTSKRGKRKQKDLELISIKITDTEPTDVSDDAQVTILEQEEY